jgi:internalin A
LQLRVYTDFNKDLDFLRHYPSVRRLAVDVFKLENFDGLKHISADLESLSLGQTKGTTHSLSFLRRFPRLRELVVSGHTKDIEVIGSLSHLEDLTLSSITLPDLSILRPLKRLHSLDIKLGGTTNLDLLPKIGRLRYLALWMIRGLTDLRPISSIGTLQYLYLRALRNVEKLPSLARLHSLRRLRLETMKGLTDLRPAAKAPALEELVVWDMRHLEPEAFRPFLRSHTLRKASVHLGSDRKTNAVADLLRLPRVDDRFAFEEPE